MGWMRVPTHFGVTITGSRSVRYRSISNEADPLPMITAACSAAVGTLLASRMSPTSARERRCGDRPLTSPETMPPRYTMRLTPADMAASAKMPAASRSRCSKDAPMPSEWIR
jgi:hypothetical protein